MSKIYNDITETIGNTPLVRLNRTAKEHGALAEIGECLVAATGIDRDRLTGHLYVHYEERAIAHLSDKRAIAAELSRLTGHALVPPPADP